MDLEAIDHLSLFMELPPRSDLIHTVECDPLLSEFATDGDNKSEYHTDNCDPEPIPSSNTTQIITQQNVSTKYPSEQIYPFPRNVELDTPTRTNIIDADHQRSHKINRKVGQPNKNRIVQKRGRIDATNKKYSRSWKNIPDIRESKSKSKRKLRQRGKKSGIPIKVKIRARKTRWDLTLNSVCERTSEEPSAVPSERDVGWNDGDDGPSNPPPDSIQGDDHTEELLVERITKKHAIKKYSCHICSLLTSCKGAYKAHLLRKHNLIYVYACVLCSMKFESMSLLIEHRKCKHFSPEKKAFSCSNCAKIFKDFHKLLCHVKVIHHANIDKEAEFCVDKNFKFNSESPDDSPLIVFKPVESGMKQTKKSVCKKPYKTSMCHICGKIFNFLGQFKEHLLKHENIKNYVCDICQKAFISRRILTIHQKIHDSMADRKYVCGFVLDDRDRKGPTGQLEAVSEENNDAVLLQQTRITQNGGTYISVDEKGRRVCIFACVSKSDLTKHQLVHLNLKPFSCPMCCMSFRQTAHLRRHIKRHSGTKEYKCDICKMEFVTKDNLNNHLRTHSDVLPYICEVCGKTFLQKTQCLKHLRRCHPNKSLIHDTPASEQKSDVSTNTHVKIENLPLEKYAAQIHADPLRMLTQNVNFNLAGQNVINTEHLS